MLHTLEPDQYQAVRRLFPGLHLDLVIDAVIAGNSPATVWVDDEARSQSAFMWDRAHSFYLAGAPDNVEFNRALCELLAANILPEFTARNLYLFKVYYTSASWESRIPGIIGNIALEKHERTFYTFGRIMIPNWRERVPAGCEIRHIDRGLLSDPHLANTVRVVEEIESCWNSLERFLKKGFGYCLLHGDEIVSWCTAEYLAGIQSGAGVETVEAYGRRGYATLAAAALVEHCASHGIRPHWDSWKANIPSVRVAEKVGFRKAVDYTVFLGRTGR